MPREHSSRSPECRDSSRPREGPSRIRSAISHWKLALAIICMSPDDFGCLHEPLAEIEEWMPEGRSEALIAMADFNIVLLATAILENSQARPPLVEAVWAHSRVAQVSAIAQSLTRIGGVAIAEDAVNQWFRRLAGGRVQDQELAAKLLAAGLVAEEEVLLALLSSSVAEVRTHAWLALGRGGAPAPRAQTPTVM